MVLAEVTQMDMKLEDGAFLRSGVRSAGVVQCLHLTVAGPGHVRIGNDGGTYKFPPASHLACQSRTGCAR
jgi:hypothetical protein